LSGEKLKELFAKRKAQKQAKKIIAGDDQVCVTDTNLKELYELPDSLWGEP
jgi:hypothetical protein